MIHQIDECCWIKDGYPVAVHGVGGRAANNTDCSQNLDSYSIEYTFADGAKALVTGRYIPNCFNDFVTYVHGTKCAAQFSGPIHAPTSMIYKSQLTSADNVSWKPPREKINPWQNEWNVFLGAIRNNRPHNETRRAVLSNLAAIMVGRPFTPERSLPGPGHELEIPVLRERRGPDCRHSGAGPRRRPGPLPGAVPGVSSEV